MVRGEQGLIGLASPFPPHPSPLPIALGNGPFLNWKHTAVLTYYRLICAGLALFMSKLFIGTSESLWNLKVFVLRLCILYFSVGICE
jgi:hypothetical protein